MLLSLALASLALRTGLALRRARRGRGRRSPTLRRSHLRLARPAVLLLLVGFVAGPISAVWLRGWEALETFHGVLGVIAAALFAWAGVLGQRIARGRSYARDTHALLGVLGILGGALAAVAGFSLLP